MVERPLDLLCLTGFLGAGKTTLLNRFIDRAGQHGQRLALLINEFGRVSIDAHLLASGDYVVEEINCGSVFCTCTQAGTLRALERTVAARPPYDLVVLEATGLADPAGLADLLNQPPLAGRIRVAANICLVDAVNFHKVLRTLPAVRRQVEEAGVLLLNKADLVSVEQLEQTRGILHEINPRAPVVVTVRADAPLETCLPAWIQGPSWTCCTPLHDACTYNHIATVTLHEDRILDRTAFERFLGSLPKWLLRGKGIVDFGNGIRHYVEWVHKEWRLSDLGPALGSPMARLVLAGAGLDERELTRRFVACCRKGELDGSP